MAATAAPQPAIPMNVRREMDQCSGTVLGAVDARRLGLRSKLRLNLDKSNASRNSRILNRPA